MPHVLALNPNTCVFPYLTQTNVIEKLSHPLFIFRETTQPSLISVQLGRNFEAREHLSYNWVEIKQILSFDTK